MAETKSSFVLLLTPDLSKYSSDWLDYGGQAVLERRSSTELQRLRASRGQGLLPLKPLRVLQQSNLFGTAADFLISCEQNERLE